MLPSRQVIKSQIMLLTRMHLIWMRAARSIPYGGLPDPPDRDPLDRDPPWTEILPEQRTLLQTETTLDRDPLPCEQITCKGKMALRTNRLTFVMH